MYYYSHFTDKVAEIPCDNWVVNQRGAGRLQTGTHFFVATHYALQPLSPVLSQQGSFRSDQRPSAKTTYNVQIDKNKHYFFHFYVLFISFS